MVGWVTTSRISWVIQNRIDLKFVDPTTRAHLIVDGNGMGAVYYRENEEIHILYRFSNDNELDIFLDELQNNIKEIIYDKENEEFIIAKRRIIVQKAKGRSSNSDISGTDTFDFGGM